MTETTTDPWSTASEVAGEATYEGPQMADLVGKVLLFSPKEHREGVITKNTRPGETQDMIVADVTVVAPKVEDCETYEDMAVFQGRLIRSLKGKVGQGMVLGKLIRDENADNRPYDLEDPSDAAKEAARAWYAAKAAPPF